MRGGGRLLPVMLPDRLLAAPERPAGGWTHRPVPGRGGLVRGGRGLPRHPHRGGAGRPVSFSFYFSYSFFFCFSFCFSFLGTGIHSPFTRSPLWPLSRRGSSGT
jgi:hypothetical protein